MRLEALKSKQKQEKNKAGFCMRIEITKDGKIK
jgi:hypothetical protein